MEKEEASPLPLTLDLLRLTPILIEIGSDKTIEQFSLFRRFFTIHRFKIFQ